MKILFLQDDFPPQSFGGAGISTYELAIGMNKAGHDISVITTCRKREDAGVANYHGIKVWRIENDYHNRWREYKSLYNRPVIKELEQILKELRPDVVHANNIHQYLSYYSLKIAKKYARAVIFTARDTMTITHGKLETKGYFNNLDPRVTWRDNLKQAGLRWNPLRNFFIKKYLGYVDRIFTISKSLQQALIKNGIKNVEVIYNGINLDEWQRDEASVNKFRAKYGLEGKKVILFSGRLSPAKGSEKTLQAVDLVREKINEAVLLVAGTGVVEPRDGVIFTGWLNRDEIKLAYFASDVVLMPSIYLDAFGRVNIEAMASKKPVLGTCYGGTPEVVVDGITGYIVNPLNAEEIAEKTLDLLKNSPKAVELGRAGYERVKTYFNLEDRVKEYVAVYRELLAKKNDD